MGDKKDASVEKAMGQGKKRRSEELVKLTVRLSSLIDEEINRSFNTSYNIDNSRCLGGPAVMSMK